MGCLLKGGGGLYSRVVVGAVLLAAGSGSRLDRIGMVTQHDGHLVDTGARQRDQLAADQRHAAELEQ